MAGNIIIHDLVKRYGPVEAVRGVSFEVPAGEIFGLLGPNGAGKTTTLECIVGLRQPDSGSIWICGIESATAPDQIRQRIGVALQSTALQDRITPREALTLFGSFYPSHAEARELIDRFALGEKADDPFDSLSDGQKQRLALALAFVNKPEVLFLDEPTAGLDPHSRRELHQSILRMQEEGRTVLLTTHYIEEANVLCNRVAIIDHGRVVAMGKPDELIAQSRALPRILLSTARPVNLRQFQELPGVAGAEIVETGVELKAASVARTVIDSVQLLEQQHNELLDLHVRRPSLEDVFIELTGNTLRRLT
jgi:ABC-2 type transport system ATP-binding protein